MNSAAYGLQSFSNKKIQGNLSWKFRKGYQYLMYYEQ